MPTTKSVLDTKGSDSIADPLEKIAMKSHNDYSDSVIDKETLLDIYFVILLQIAIR